MAYTNIVQLDYIPEEFLEWFYADVIKLEFSDDNDAENLYKICNLGSESTNFLKFTGSIPFLFGVYIVLVIICTALSVLCWPSRFCFKKRRATLHEEDEEEVSFIQKYT